MVFLIAGASHTGKTALAQRLLEKYGYPYLSIDHLKMGLIRSGIAPLTPLSSDEELTDYLWPVVREMVKTVIENGQNLIVEGCYIPFNWSEDFGPEYRRQIQYRCLIMSEAYIRSHYQEIKAFANVVEHRIDDSDCTLETLLRDNARMLEACRKKNAAYVLIDKSYHVDI